MMNICYRFPSTMVYNRFKFVDNLTSRLILRISLEYSQCKFEQDFRFKWIITTVQCLVLQSLQNKEEKIVPCKKKCKNYIFWIYFRIASGFFSNSFKIILMYYFTANLKNKFCLFICLFTKCVSTVTHFYYLQFIFLKRNSTTVNFTQVLFRCVCLFYHWYDVFISFIKRYDVIVNNFYEWMKKNKNYFHTKSFVYLYNILV